VFANPETPAKKLTQPADELMSYGHRAQTAPIKPRSRRLNWGREIKKRNHARPSTNHTENLNMWTQPRKTFVLKEWTQKNERRAVMTRR